MSKQEIAVQNPSVPKALINIAKNLVLIPVHLGVTANNYIWIGIHKAEGAVVRYVSGK